MRLVLTSDLHVDHHPEVVRLVGERARALAPEVLIVAGDVSHELEHVVEALAALRREAPRVLFIPGNHDLWCGAEGPSSRARYEEELPRRLAAVGVDALGTAPIEINGVVFAGVTGWYDYSLRNRELDAVFSLDDYKKGAWHHLRWNDKARVRWPGDDGALLDDPAICAEQVARLGHQLADAGTRPTVVVTHHVPFAALTTSYTQLGRAGDPDAARLGWDFINGFMGSARLGEAMQRASGVVAAVCGHTHFKKRTSVDGAGGRRFTAETSPIGYPREYKKYGGLTLEERVLDRVTAIDLG